MSVRRDRVPANPRVTSLRLHCVADTGTADEVPRLQSLWRCRVPTLIERADEVIVVQH
jgi:hypothetical protein